MRLDHEYILKTLQKLLTMTPEDRRSYLAAVEIQHGIDSTIYTFLSDSVTFIDRYSN